MAKNKNIVIAIILTLFVTLLSWGFRIDILELSISLMVILAGLHKTVLRDAELEDLEHSLGKNLEKVEEGSKTQGGQTRRFRTQPGKKPREG